MIISVDTLCGFAPLDTSHQSNHFISSSPQVCHAYAIIRERDSKETKTICGGVTRTEDVYLSSTSSVEVRLFSRRGSNSAPRFLMMYQGEARTDLLVVGTSTRSKVNNLDTKTMEITYNVVTSLHSMNATTNKSRWLQLRLFAVVCNITFSI